MSKVKQFDSLSTSYVNLAALLRHLRQEGFFGSVHVTLNQYEAEVQINGPDDPTVSEINQSTREAEQSAGALERLLVHAREPGGVITVYQTGDAPDAIISEQTPEPTVESELFASQLSQPAEVEVDWSDLLDSAGKVIGAVERAVKSSGADFESSFRAACIQLGDDYPFLDPTGNGLSYAAKRVTLDYQPASNVFVNGLTECLRRVINKTAIGKDSKRFRETVAIELAVAARMRPTGLSEFMSHLDQIAGTRVL